MKNWIFFTAFTVFAILANAQEPIDFFRRSSPLQEIVGHYCLAFPDGEMLNPLTQEEIRSPYAKLWKPGQTIKVKFLNGTAWQKSKVKQYAVRWTYHCNLSFEFVEYGYADIRVAFNWQGDNGSWSMIGTDALKEPQSNPTVNFGWVKENEVEQSVRRVILHEFGHVLGCGHEHQSPAARIDWDKPAVYAHYAQMGWSREDVDAQVLKKSRASIYSEFDPNSIMLYEIDGSNTRTGLTYEAANDLSDMDKKVIRFVYPYISDAAPVIDIKSPGTKFNLVWVEYDVFDGGQKGMRIHADFDIEYMKGMDCRMVAWFEFNNGSDLKDYNQQYRTVDGHVSSGVDFKPGYTNTNYSDLWVFIPYEELHLSRGKHALRFSLGICSATDQIGYSSDYQYFNVTN